MKTFKIKIHSTVDLITNSSTVIFTYQDGCDKAVKELVNTMLKTFGKTETFDDIFYAGIFLDGNDSYFLDDEEDIEDENKFPELGWTEVMDLNWSDPKMVEWRESREKYLKDIKLQVMKGEIEKPQWMKYAEEREQYDYYAPDTSLELIPKDEKYSELANQLLKYLNTPGHEATRDG